MTLQKFEATLDRNKSTPNLPSSLGLSIHEPTPKLTQSDIFCSSSSSFETKVANKVEALYDDALEDVHNSLSAYKHNTTEIVDSKLGLLEDQTNNFIHKKMAEFAAEIEQAIEKINNSNSDGKTDHVEHNTIGKTHIIQPSTMRETPTRLTCSQAKLLKPRAGCQSPKLK